MKLLLPLFTILAFSSCATNKVANMTNSLSIGMTKQQVISMFGSPMKSSVYLNGKGQEVLEFPAGGKFLGQDIAPASGKKVIVTLKEGKVVGYSSDRWYNTDA